MNKVWFALGMASHQGRRILTSGTERRLKTGFRRDSIFTAGGHKQVKGEHECSAVAPLGWQLRYLSGEQELAAQESLPSSQAAFLQSADVIKTTRTVTVKHISTFHFLCPEF